MIATIERNTSPCSLISTLPGEKAILCSKDKSFANHPGNLMFRDRIETMTPRYLRCRSKTEKMQMTKDIVSEFNACGARFLKIYDGEWVEISNQAARDKVSHALRFAANRDKKAKSASKMARRSSTPKSTRSRTSYKRSKQISREEPASSSSSQCLSSSCVDRALEQQQDILHRMVDAKNGTAAPNLITSVPSTTAPPSLLEELKSCWDAIAPPSAALGCDDAEPLPMEAAAVVSDSSSAKESDFALFDDLDLEMISSDVPLQSEQRNPTLFRV
mmetsp:Transcript_15559/g.33932  ORF Transcript_15559/g.33932 Transcript_15559/m.33932 type:complete len:274 (+) Transcript_15559:134-955(+)|eukprot:CAMPEP_0168734164 /NCGR_PEP_ID=MMETSP0724-20121128/8670_1 /TAXON_ID=265536 /ORGANISM="Amphiprora sp., Strain CCMP467" /LENGTH=273 /DNA_ID=CAMNT_0008781255 /DNA_START=115 /DNA_END=936 /DNA_ORIENTATION=-